MKKKYRLLKNPKFVAISLAMVTTLSGAFVIRERKRNDDIHASKEYSIGYLDLNMMNNQLFKKIKKGNFILFDIGDHDTDGCYFLKQKLAYCQKNGIDVGLILSSNSNSMGEVYLDIAWIKDLIKKYSITYPVYLDVDKLMTNPNLRYDEACRMIEVMIKKLKANHIAVGLYGGKENIQQEWLDDVFNDSFFKEDNQDSQIKTQYSKKGNVDYLYTTKDLKEGIKENHKNLDSLLLEDEYVVYQDSFDFQKLAKSCGLSVNDLKEYNGLNFPFSFLKRSEVIEVPSLNYQTRRHLLNQPNLGIDVSLWQEEIDWEKVEVNYAMIQIRDFANENADPFFNTNVAGCMKNNIPMGFYAFSRATTMDELRQEISYIKKKLVDIPVTYPVYLDLETDFWTSNTDEDYSQNKDFFQYFIQTWEEEMKIAGYTPGIYCNMDLYHHLNEATDGMLENLSCWVAGGEYYDQIISPNDLSSLDISLDDKVEMRQISSKGVMEGISSDVDIDLCYYDYQEENPHREKTFYRLNHEIDVIKKIGIGIGIIYVSARIKLSCHKKRRKRRKRSRMN